MSRDPEPGRRAREYLSQRLVRPFPGAELPSFPPIAVLARDAGVGYTTMWKAVREFRDRGLLRVVPHVGISANEDAAELPQPPSRPVSPSSRVDMVAERIERDIATGRLTRSEPLPTMRELCTRYGASFRTVRSALVRLVSEGTISPAGRRFAPSRVARFGANATVVLVARGDDLGRINMLTERSRVLLRTLEDACFHANLTLRVHTHNFSGPRWQGIDELSALADGQGLTGPVVGFIVWDMGLNMDLLGSILPFLNRSGKPVALLDEMGWGAHLRERFGGRLMAVFSMAANVSDGMRVGRRLHELGHRRLAYFGLRHVSTAGDARLQGLRAVAERLGDATVDVYRGSETWDDVTRTRDDLLVQRVAGFLSEQFGEYGSVSGRAMQDATLALGRVQTLMRTQRAMGEKFGEALRVGRATVWVAFNDTIACAAMEFLERRGIDVPGRVSVVGFDNGQAAFARNLTSYEFGSTMYANATLSYVLNPAGGTFRARRTTPVVFDGYLVERASSRAVQT